MGLNEDCEKLGIDMKLHTLKLEYFLSDCPQSWRNFIAWHEDHFTNWERALKTEYNAYANSKDPKNIVVIFPTQEEKAQFILTWN
jgi:hypothetical protein